MKHAFFPILFLSALSGCGSKQTDDKPAADASAILPGSASDAMLPYDTVKSQPPLAPKAVEKAVAPKVQADTGPGPAPIEQAAPPTSETAPEQ